MSTPGGFRTVTQWRSRRLPPPWARFLKARAGSIGLFALFALGAYAGWASLHAARQSVAELRAEVTAVRQGLAGLREEVAATRDRLAGVEARVVTLEGAVGTVEGTVTALEGSLTGVQERMDDLATAAAAPREAPRGRPPDRPPTYSVRPGDTLWGISSRLLGDPWRYAEIAALNGLSPADLLYPGTLLRLPPRTEAISGSAPGTF